MIKNMIGVIALIVVTTFTGCGFAPNDNKLSTGGTGSEVVGVVNYPDSTSAMRKINGSKLLFPVKNAGVFIHPERYYAENETTADIPEVFTGNDGSFRIVNVLPGNHLIYIRDGSGKAIAHKVIVPDEGRRIDVGTLYVKPAATAQIQYQGVLPGSVLFYVSVRGTGITVKCTERNVYAVLGNIPLGLTNGYMVTIRVLQPFNNGKDITVPSLNLDQINTLQPFIDF